MLRWIQSKNLQYIQDTLSKSSSSCPKLAFSNMAIPVVAISREGYKIKRFLANNQLQSNEIIEFCELV